MSYEQFEGSVIVPGLPVRDKTVKSARRTIELLEFFVEHRRPANLLTISQALRYPASSTAALAKSLTVLGYLHYDSSTRTYFPTLRISLLGGWLQDQYFSDTKTLDLMNAIAKETRQTVILAMQSGIHVQYLMVIQGHEHLRAYTRIGSLRPICRASTGLMLLTLAPVEALRGIVNHANSLEKEPSARVMFKDLVKELDECRARGYATTSGNVTPGLGTVAMLLPRSERHVPLVIAVGGPLEAQREEMPDWIRIMRDRIADYYPKLTRTV
ncbi:IclR family transcriptional regulator [Mesorhizobium australicum]|uniref:Transcriptional regulator, IclR family n=1 Tax=Mesorhizobium australicum TaxID=536018 RepID=A0A1X7PWJ1_9HYPH|nr:helix-turn-helix domain-containing protein [Mesorhizobium australicum]SMH56458.1 transcriptional regulator, IclR family [Mesorhizobium australicum]